MPVGPEASEDEDTAGEAEEVKERAARCPGELAAEPEAAADSEARPAEDEAKRGAYGTGSWEPFNPSLTRTRNGTMGLRTMRMR